MRMGENERGKGPFCNIYRQKYIFEVQGFMSKHMYHKIYFDLRSQNIDSAVFLSGTCAPKALKMPAILTFTKLNIPDHRL